MGNFMNKPSSFQTNMADSIDIIVQTKLKRSRKAEAL